MNSLPDGYRLSFSPNDADPAAAHAYLTRSYWSPGISLETVTRAMKHSFCSTVHGSEGQVAMARVITDYATHAYLADVYVLEDHQGIGIAQAMIGGTVDHPDLEDVRRWMLFTRDAHSLYARFGWEVLTAPERAMIRELADDV